MVSSEFAAGLLGVRRAVLHVGHFPTETPPEPATAGAGWSVLLGGALAVGLAATLAWYVIGYRR